MKIKSENGITISDYVLGIIIFIIGAVSILNLYIQIYKLTARVKIDETIMGYITEVCEKIDLESYDSIDKDRVNEIIESAKIPSNYTVQCFDIEKYSEDYLQTEGTEIPDVVKKVYINVKYNFNKMDRDYEISKVKIRE